MRTTRETLLAGYGDERSAIYHVVSRVSGREFLLGDEEREKFVRMMRDYEHFCGVRVLTHCIAWGQTLRRKELDVLSML